MLRQALCCTSDQGLAGGFWQQKVGMTYCLTARKTMVRALGLRVPLLANNSVFNRFYSSGLV